MTKKRTALPPKRDEGPEGLPEELPVVEAEARKTALDTARFCPTCKQEARINSNHLGVRAYCNNCRTDWPISGPAILDLPASLPRGLSKQTLVEPDIQLAFEDVEFEDEYKRSR
jgi:hypothetical protein